MKSRKSRFVDSTEANGVRVSVYRIKRGTWRINVMQLDNGMYTHYLFGGSGITEDDVLAEARSAAESWKKWPDADHMIIWE